MTDLFKLCCTKDPKGSEADLANMDRVNGHVNKACPFSDSVNAGDGKVKPNLQIKVPRPIKLKNHLENYENYDVLHSRETASCVSASNIYLIC